MQTAQAAGHESTDEIDLARELTAFASLLHVGEYESQESYRTGVKWLPAGVLLEQLIADITIVYSPPKVGSSTITATLNRHPVVRPEALHLHSLSPAGLANLENQIAECAHPNIRYFRDHLAQGRGVRMLLAANRALRASGLSATVRKPYLIAGVREPLALSLSLAFEGWWLHANNPNDMSIDFLRASMLHAPMCRICDDWFSDELATVFGVDVYARAFPKARGWDIYENDAARVLVIRQENLDRLPDALGALYGLDPSTFIVESCNVSAKKTYADHYAMVNRTLRLTEPELDQSYSARYVGHFYTEQEIAGFRRRWSMGQGAAEGSLLQPSSPTATMVSPKPACGSPSAPTSPRHIWGCRPCWRCEQQLNSIPGLQHTCTEQEVQLRHLHAACLAAQQAAALQSEQAAALQAEQAAVQTTRGANANSLRSIARRILPKPLRSLARRVLGGARRDAQS